jgi:hypothetical protein
LDGDIVVGDSTEQEISLIIGTNQGEWKQSPLSGLGFVKKMKSNISNDALEQEIDTQLKYDGMDEVVVHFEKGLLTGVFANRP